MVFNKAIILSIFYWLNCNILGRNLYTIFGLLIPSFSPDYGLAVAVNVVVATYVSFGIAGDGLAAIPTRNESVVVAPVPAVAVPRLIICTAVVVAPNQQFPVVGDPPD